MTESPRTLLLTGATGFVGNAVRPSLVAKGWSVRCLTRDASRARRRLPAVDWVEGDVGDPASAARALAGCEAAVYLVHGIGEGADYHQREVAAATTFSRAAESAGVKRIVYLGGIAPAGAGSEHLRSRLHVGEALRSGPVPTVELRASMIVGHGSLSWLIVRDLAARLPFMILPQWLKSRTQPVAIADVVVALVGALDLQLAGSASFDIPGPFTLSGKSILEETARVLGLPHPRMIEVPLLSPRLSSLWVRFVTRAQWSVAREVVVGLAEDLLARDDRFWGLIDHPKRLTFAEAARLAVDAERTDGPVRGTWGAIEHIRGLRERSV
ncbi:MAG TPA: NAD(P)H-binding protein [Polyangia bacterium]|nr:NAD(P)H-binding protein [Polyangia bacterium]